MANLIQIKRSLNTGTTPTLANGELAYTANGDILFIGSNGATVAIGGQRVPGVLTANQALIANSTSGIDKVIVANLVPTTVWANGQSGAAGQVLTSNGTTLYWNTPLPGVVGSNTEIQFNDSGTLGSDPGLTYDKTTDTLTTNTLSTSTVNTSVLNAGNVTINTTALIIGTSAGINANGTVGSAGQVLHSNGSSAYWANTTADITSVTAGDGLTGGGSSGDLTLTVVAGANGGLISNSTGVWVAAGNGLFTDSSGLNIGAGNGISVSADSFRVQQANGIAVDAGGVRVDASSTGGLVSNATGLHIRPGDGLVTNTTGVHILTSGDSTLIANSTGLFVNDASLSISSSQLSTDVALGTQTSGNYVATISAGDGISGSSSSEGGTPTIAVVANNGIAANSSGVFAVAANGISVDSAGISVIGNTGVTVNTSGVHIGQDVKTTSNVTFANVVTSNLSITGTVSSNVIPVANLTYHLGNTTNRWAQIHAGNGHFVTGTFDGNVNVAGDLIVVGNVTTTNVNSVVISDPMIYLAGNNYTSDLVDIGIAANYNDGTNRHTGLFRDHVDGNWKLFTNLTQELSGNNDVDTSDPSYRIATLEAYLISSGLFSNSSVTNITANSTVSVTITANTLTLSSPLAGTSGGTGKSTMTSEAILVGNTSNGYRELTLGTSGYVLQSNGTALVYDTLDGGTY